MDNQIYLGDGAYANFTGHDFIITANPGLATDKVHLEPHAIQRLYEWPQDGS